MEEQTLKCVRNAERNILIQSGMNDTETEKTWEERQDGSDLKWETSNVLNKVNRHSQSSRLIIFVVLLVIQFIQVFRQLYLNTGTKTICIKADWSLLPCPCNCPTLLISLICSPTVIYQVDRGIVSSDRTFGMGMWFLCV